MIPHIVIFYKQFDQPFSKTDKNSQAFRPFFSRSMGISGTILCRFGSRLLPQLRYTMERASRAHIQIIRRSAAGRLFLTYSL